MKYIFSRRVKKDERGSGKFLEDLTKATPVFCSDSNWGQENSPFPVHTKYKKGFFMAAEKREKYETDLEGKKDLFKTVRAPLAAAQAQRTELSDSRSQISFFFFQRSHKELPTPSFSSQEKFPLYYKFIHLFTSFIQVSVHGDIFFY